MEMCVPYVDASHVGNAFCVVSAYAGDVYCVCVCVCECSTYVGELLCVPCVCYNMNWKYVSSVCALHMLIHVREICVVFV